MSDRLPEGWSSVPLNELVSAQKGKKPDVLSESPMAGFVPYLDIHAIEKNEVRQFAEGKSSRLATKNDLFVVWDGARSGWIGSGISGAVGSTIMALTPQQVASDYLRHFIAGQFQTINTNTKGTGIPHVDPEVFWSLEVPLAPLPEQRRIVAKLEMLLGKVDACNKRLTKIPVILKRFRQSILAVACSGRLTADWREKNPNAGAIRRVAQSGRGTASPLQNAGDDLPEGWGICSIANVGKISNGSTPSRKCSEYWAGDIPWVSSGEVRNNIISNTRELITKKGFDNSSVRLLPPGTVLLAMIGEGKTRGQTAILQIAATINQNIAAVVIEQELITSKYLWYWFQFQYESTRQSGSGSGPQALNCQRVRELPLNLPPLPEQQEIVRRVEALFALADQIEARYMKAKAYVDKLSQSILAKAFCGELVPQDPNDEPASVLLERIKREHVKKEVEAKRRKMSNKKR